MALTAAQVNTRIDAAWEAVNLGELSYTVNGRTLQYHSLNAFQKHIDWLRDLYADLTEEAAIDAGGGGAPLVSFQEPQ